MTRVGRGKEVDHLYKDRQLIFADASQKIWFIGDSKYYKEKNDIVGESVYKQFTYARNIIQYNINDLLKGDGQNGEGVLRYRDPLTEGYSVTPNFFIRGEVDKGNPCEIPATGDAIKKDAADMWAERNRHFENRLFDRDTLLLQVYDVNFLYVLKAFTAKNSALREEFKRTAREKFRKNFLKLLDEKYLFFKIVPKIVEEKDRKKFFEGFINRRFRKWVGKMFCPSKAETENGLFFIYAEERGCYEKDDSISKCGPIKGVCEIDGDVFWKFPLSAQDVVHSVYNDDFNKDDFGNTLKVQGFDIKTDNFAKSGCVEIHRSCYDAKQSRIPAYVSVDNDDKFFIVVGEPNQPDDSEWLSLPVVCVKGQL